MSMDREAIEKRIFAIIEEEIATDVKVSNDTGLGELGADRVEMVEIFIAINNEFGTGLEILDLPEFETVRDLVNAAERSQISKG